MCIYFINQIINYINRVINFINHPTKIWLLANKLLTLLIWYDLSKCLIFQKVTKLYINHPTKIWLQANKLLTLSIG